jgi:tetratricopeptide (TPR) repeat protein
MPKQARRFVVAIARLRGDRDGQMQAFVRDEMRQLDDELQVMESREMPPIDSFTELATGKGRETIDAVLASSDADLLIWGQVITLDPHNPLARLFFATSASSSGGQTGMATARYGTEGGALPTEFWRNVGDILKLVVLSQASSFDDFRYQVKTIEPFIERAKGLVGSAVVKNKWSPESRWALLAAYAGALQVLGSQTGDNEKLKESIHVYGSLLDVEHDKVPMNLAWTLDNLGIALAVLGERESDTDTLQQAVAALNKALKEYTRERTPLNWARTQMNLGSTLVGLGERESGTDTLEQAVAAYNEALKEFSRERVPLDWARTQMNLGNALARLGERESGTDTLEQAVAAYNEALKEFSRERVPLDWAGAQVNLGNALTSLGKRESGTDTLQPAVTVYHEALKEYTRERVPLDWARTQSNLGNALRLLGERQSSRATLRLAVTAYNEALKEYTRERVPLDWAVTQMNLGSTLVRLGERESGTDTLEKAVAAYNEALKEFSRERVPLDWAGTQLNLGLALARLGERESGTDTLQKAIAAYNEALKEFSRERVPLDWAGTQLNLGDALGLIEQRRGLMPCEALIAFIQADSVFRGSSDYHAQMAISGIRACMSSATEPTPKDCPTISTQQWEQVRAAISTANQ